MKIKDVINLLFEKDQEQEVQFIVASTDGAIVAMEAQSDFVYITKFLGAFKKPKANPANSAPPLRKKINRKEA